MIITNVIFNSPSITSIQDTPSTDLLAFSEGEQLEMAIQLSLQGPEMGEAQSSMPFSTTTDDAQASQLLMHSEEVCISF